MDMKAVNSSQVASIGYDSSKKVLTVKFVSGGTYTYAGVTPDLHAGLLKAKSVGGYLSKHVKGRFEYKKAK